MKHQRFYEEIAEFIPLVQALAKKAFEEMAPQIESLIAGELEEQEKLKKILLNDKAIIAQHKNLTDMRKNVNKTRSLSEHSFKSIKTEIIFDSSPVPMVPNFELPELLIEHSSEELSRNELEKLLITLIQTKFAAIEFIPDEELSTTTRNIRAALEKLINEDTRGENEEGKIKSILIDKVSHYVLIVIESCYLKNYLGLLNNIEQDYAGRTCYYKQYAKENGIDLEEKPQVDPFIEAASEKKPQWKRTSSQTKMHLSKVSFLNTSLTNIGQSNLRQASSDSDVRKESKIVPRSAHSKQSLNLLSTGLRKASSGSDISTSEKIVKSQRPGDR